MGPAVRRAVCAAFFVLVLGFGVLPEAARAADWCGTAATADRPAVFGGNSIRVIYAIPADGQDGSAALAPKISADVDQIDAWWRANDSSRTPRFDVTPFACGLQVDLTVRRLAATIGDLLPDETRFGRIAADISAAGLDLRVSKYLVYYDGPVADRRLCGTGGGAFAIVYVQACSSVGAATVATHELLHALGAMRPAGAPNACPGDPGHVCDSTGDILYPFAQPAPLSSFVLDLGRDDYYGHGLPTFDVQDSFWLRRLDAPASLSIVIDGPGTVSSSFAGFSCVQSCQTEWNAGTELNLFAEAADGQRFLGWSGACNHQSPGCATVLGATNEVTARFGPAAFRLGIAVTGRGRVHASSGFACAARCARSVTSFTPVTLRAAPAKGWRLKSWSGVCKGSRTRCTVPMRAAASVRATFVRR